MRRPPSFVGSKTRFALCNAPPSDATHPAGPPRLDAAAPGGGLLRCSSPRLGSQIRDNVCIVQRAPSSRCALGRTPAANAAAPGGGLLRCPNLRLGLLFAAWDHPRHERTPQKPRKRLIIDPLRGSRRPDAGVRPNEVRRGRVAQHTRPLLQHENGRAAQHTRLAMQRPRATARAAFRVARSTQRNYHKAMTSVWKQLPNHSTEMTPCSRTCSNTR